MIFLLDPLKPYFYYISTGLRGSISHGGFSMMRVTGDRIAWTCLHDWLNTHSRENMELNTAFSSIY